MTSKKPMMTKQVF